MKRILIVLTLVLCLSITGCSKKKEETKPDPTAQTKPEQQTQKEESKDKEKTEEVIGKEDKQEDKQKKEETDSKEKESGVDHSKQDSYATDEKIHVEHKENVPTGNSKEAYGSLSEINSKADVEIVKPGFEGVSKETYNIVNGAIAEYNFDIDGCSFTVRGAAVTKSDISGIEDSRNEFSPNEDFIVYTGDYYLERFFDGNRQYTIVLNNTIGVREESFVNVCAGFENEMKYHIHDSLTGSYEDSKTHKAAASVIQNGDVYIVSVSVGTSYGMDLYYIEATKDGNKLTYQKESLTRINGGDTESKDLKFSGYFTIDDGKLLWSKASDSSLQEFVFEKVMYDE